MPSQVTKYKIVISSPSDIIEELDVVSEVIDYWNITNSDDYGAMLEPVSWKTHATSEIGDRPQAIINKQLELKDCDILIAIFWTRLGTPTGEAESGTIEEIEVFRKAGKPVSIYFSSIPVSPKNIDIEQYKRLSEIIEKYKNDGLVIDYNSIEQFRSKLLMDIPRKIKLIRKATIEVPKESRAIEGHKKQSSTVKTIVYPKPIQPLKIIPSRIAVSSGCGGGSGVPSNINAIITIKPRIYDEKKQPPIGSAQLPSYKWDAQNFEGFWYDLKAGITSETLEIGEPLGNHLTTTIDHTRRTIPEKALVYQTIKQMVQYKVNEANSINKVEQAYDSSGTKQSSGAGYYYKIGWQGEQYVALNGKAKKLSKLILEQGTTDTKSLAVGETWDMGEGYSVTAQAIDAKSFPRQAWLVLSKDGVKKDDKVIAQGNVYTYVERSIGGESDCPIFVTYIDSVFAGATSDMIQLKYSWLISSSVIEIKGGDTFGIMEVIDASDCYLILRSKKPINLPKDSTVDIMSYLKFKVADDHNFLRFHPMVLR